jgi:hypothetical protein
MRLVVTSLILVCLVSMSFGQTVQAQAGVAGADLADALAAINGGYAADVIELITDGGFYEFSATDSISVPLTIRAAAGLAVKPTIRAAVGDTLGRYLEVWADFTVENVIFEGTRSDGSLNIFSSKDVIAIVPNPATGTQANTPRLDITIRGCEFYNVSESGTTEVSGKANAIRVTKDDTDVASGVKAVLGVMLVEDCHFENIYDEVILAQKVSGTDDDAIRVADSVYVRNSTFVNCAGPDNQACIAFKGAKGAQVLTAVLTFENLTFYNSNARTIYSRESENVTVRNILIANTNPLGKAGTLINIDRDGSSISHINTFDIDTTGMSTFVLFEGGPGEQTGYGNATIDEATLYEYDPDFTDAANGNLEVNSPYLYFRSSTGGFIGDIRWATAPPPVGTAPETKPMAFSLSQNYPNPFNPSTSINFTLEMESKVSLVVHDMRGAEVATLVSETRPSGSYTASWNAAEATAGLYVYTLTTNGQSISKKMLLLK